ncbi:hypothetical protein [Methylobacterium sp. Leaf111]|uniref:hypothetical protein n=1 Tax=Methylobacterium sp. Leaf111 TaxID=1736257 RepID=UPI0012E75731|nr:hypothetical protein [Methylobacterium sp. Leaf111]
MAVTPEVMELVQILDSENFGEIAGEILQEVNAGRVFDSDTGSLSSQSATTGSDEIQPKRQPIEPSDQLSEAIRILRLRLVEPARHLAEAERIASKITKHDLVRIEFVEDTSGESTREKDRAAPGDQELPDRLDDLLSQLLVNQGP